ncbi:hypothetical protein ACWEVP_44695 [Amycolatopsis sp. NPDC003865]
MERSCPQVTTAATYLLGALEPADATAYRRHIRFCIPCRREVDELEPVVRLLEAVKADVEATARRHA